MNNNMAFINYVVVLLRYILSEVQYNYTDTCCHNLCSLLHCAVLLSKAAIQAVYFKGLLMIYVADPTSYRCRNHLLCSGPFGHAYASDGLQTGLCVVIRMRVGAQIGVGVPGP